MNSETSFGSESFRMTPANPDQHLMPIAQITADAFANGQYVKEISQQYIGNCHYDWDTSRLIWDDDQLIHHWGVWGYPMRLASTQLKVAGVGAVVTRKPYRKRGLMQRAAQASLQAMQENGYDLSILRGRHYAKFGYVRAWNYVTYRLTLEEIPSPSIQTDYRRLGPDRMDEIITLYNQSYQSFSGTAVRPTYRMLKADDMGSYGWFDDAGELAGYVRAVPTEDKKTLQCLEAAGDPQAGLSVLSSLFQEGEYETLTFFTFPHQHPLVSFIRRGSCIVENRFFYHTGWQVRIVNLQSTLHKIRPLLENRLQRSHLGSWQGSLHLDAGQHSACLAIRAGRLEIAVANPTPHQIQGGPAIARLLIGSDEPAEIIQQEQMLCSGQANELAQILFPNLYPMMSHWDEF